MTDLRALNEAFAELERRADVASVSQPVPAPALDRRSRSRRLMPVAAAATVVAGLAAGTVWLLPGGGDSSSVAAGNAPTTSESTVTSSVAATPKLPKLPQNPEELITRFTEVLGDTATFDVTDSAPAIHLPAPSLPDESEGTRNTSEGQPWGGAIVGTLTASGVTGGFDLLVYEHVEGKTPRTECGPRTCQSETLPDGSRLTVDQIALDGSTGVTNEVTLYRADGAKLSMHVSSERSAKGHSEVIAPHPPLTTEQMVEILTSDLW